MANLSNPLAGFRFWWLRQLSDTAEGTIANIIATLQAACGPQAGLALKVMDGVTWQGDIDPLTPVHSVADVLAVKAQCNAAGIAFLPVIVPRGVTGEYALHAEIAMAIDCAMFDLEPYAGLYDQSPLSTVPGYCANLRKWAPTATLVLEPDPRAYAWAALNVPAIAQYFDAISPQDYVGWAEIGWTDVAAEVATFQEFVALGKPVMPSLWGTSDDLTIPAQFWQAIVGRECGMVVFALGPMNLLDLTTFGGLTLSQPTPAPTPTPPASVNVPDATAQLVGAANDAINAVSDLLGAPDVASATGRAHSATAKLQTALADLGTG